jgi:acetylornithine deacetylase/succinyl-diaminopimelate desuccinylase-like protein
LLRAHLDRSGFADVRVEVLASVEVAKTDPDSEIAQAAVAAARALYGEPIVKPTEEYAGRQGVWLGNRLGAAGVGTGVGPPGHRGHAVDEFVTVESLIRGIKFAAAIFEHYARL